MSSARNRAQFSIKHAAVVAIIMAIGLAWWMDHSSLSKRAGDAVRDRNQTIRLTEHFHVQFDARQNPVSVEPYGYTPICDEHLELLSGYPTIEEVDLSCCANISDDGVAHLKKLNRLRILRLYRNNPTPKHDYCSQYAPNQPTLTDTSLKHVSRIASLEKLYLWDNNFGDEGILALANLANAKEICFRSNAVSEYTIEKLRKSLPDTNIDCD